MAAPAPLIAIRPIVAADYEAAADLDRRHSPVLRRGEQFARTVADGAIAMVAAEADTVRGFAVLVPALDEATLLNIVVDSGQRGRGLGRRLLHATLDAARRRGLRRVLLEVRAGNASALKLYREAGFSRDGLRRNYYGARDGAPAEDAILMSLDLEDDFARSGD